MNFASTRIITGDMKRLVRFYEDTTGLRATWYTEDFAEIKTRSATLAIGSVRTIAMFGENVARAASNQSAIIEFRVDDVDSEYDKLRNVVNEFVQTPTTMP